MADTTPDYSNSPLAPTQVTWTADGTGFRTTLSNAVGGTDPKDYVTFTVPAGQRLTSFELSSYSSSDGVAFIALQPGSTVTGSESNTTPLSGYTHFGSSSSVKVGTNLIALLGGPLETGIYSAWIQQLGASTDYSFTVKTTALPDTTPPTIAITSNKTALKVGETALINFTLSEPATDFVLSDIAVSGGALTNFNGSGTSYSVTFTPTANSTSAGSVSVGNFKFSDAAGNANEDGSDTNNKVSFAIDTIPPTVTMASSKTFLGFGEVGAVTFRLSEPSADFTLSSVKVTNGNLVDFSGSDVVYTAKFVPNSTELGVLEIKQKGFADFAGNTIGASPTPIIFVPYNPFSVNVVLTKLVGSSSWEFGKALTSGKDGAIYLGGYTEGSLDGQTNIGSQDAFITKFNVDGTKVWTRLLGSSGADSASALTTGHDGAVYLAGSTEGNLDGQTNSGGRDAFITKFNVDGTKVWTRLLGSTLGDGAYALTTGSDGAIYMAGSAAGSLAGQAYRGQEDVLLAKYSPNGNLEWANLFGSSGYERIRALTTGNDGAIYVAGSTNGNLGGQINGGGDDAFVAKFSPDGTSLWTRLFSSNMADEAYALATGLDGEVYVAGRSNGNFEGQTSSGNWDAFITKLKPDGAKAWTRLLGTSSSDGAFALTNDADGAIYMVGSTKGNLDGQTNIRSQDAFITKFNVDGTKVWTRLLGSNEEVIASALTTGNDGAVYLAGTTVGNLGGEINSGGTDAFIIKLNVPDNSLPKIALTSSKLAIKTGEETTIYFSLSKPATDFVATDVSVQGGVLSNFEGSGQNYTAIFIRSNKELAGVVSVASGKFSDAFGSFNEDGSEVNNTVTLGDPLPTYVISADTNAANEGASARFTLTTTNVDAGVLIPYTISGLSTADIEGGLLTGSVAVDADGRATINIPILADQVTEGDETLTVTVQDKTATTVIKDTSLNPAPTYQVTANAAKVSEGSTAVFTVVTTNVASGTSLNYALSGVSASDISSGSLSGSVQVGSNGQALINVGLVADQKTEGDEVLTVTLQGKSASVFIVDSSQDPPPTYALAASGASVDEGSSVVFTLSTTNVATGTVIPFVLSGVATSDLSGSLTGSFTIGANGKASATIGILADKTTEGAETLTMTAQGQSASVVIQDTSTYAKLSSTLKVAAGEIVQIGKQVPILQGYDPDWTKMTAGSLEQFNVNGRGNGDNVIRAVNVMTILDDPADGRQIDPSRLGFWVEQIEEGTLAKGDAIMNNILSGFVYGKEFSDLALMRMDTDGDGKVDISYTKAAVQTMYRNVLGRSWADIVNDGGLNYLVGEIEANRLTIVDVAERVCLGAEAINSAVGIVGQQDLSFIAFGDGFGG